MHGLRGGADAADVLAMPRRRHAVPSFGVLLVQGALEEELGVAVVPRTHGEDIRSDETSRHGERPDPAKRASIDDNIRRVGRHVVIGGHVRSLILEIAPQAEVRRATSSARG